MDRTEAYIKALGIVIETLKEQFAHITVGENKRVDAEAFTIIFQLERRLQKLQKLQSRKGAVCTKN